LKKSISPTDEALVRITARYVEQVCSGRRPHLSDYLVRYPDYADELVDFVAYYHALEEHVSSETDTSVEALSEVSQFGLEYAARHVCLSGEDRPCQLTTLFMKSDRQHLSLLSLAKELDLSVDIVVQLEQRRIGPLSIPLELSRQLSRILQQPLYAVQTYFADDSNSWYGVSDSRKNFQQSVAEQQETYSLLTSESAQQLSFHQTLTASTQMSDRQKDRWCKIIEHENM
jgi:hypothetical protein